MGSSMHYLAVGIGLSFVVLGLLTVAPIQPAHNQLVSMNGRHAGVFPLKFVGIQPSADMYTALVAVFEIMLGSLLAFGRYDWRALSCLGLLILMVTTVWGMLALGDPIAQFFPFLVLGGLLLVLLFHPNGFWGNRGKVHLS